MKRNKSKTSCKRGFTLIELLVVVLIIGILAAVAVPQYQKALYRSRYAMLKTLTKSIVTAEEAYYLANGQHATKFEDLDVDMPGGKLNTSTDNRYYYDWGFCVITATQAICQNNDIGLNHSYRFLSGSLEPGSRVCTALSTEQNSIQNQICKMETGQSNKTGGVAEHYFAYHYQN